jgi:hypothetical protein
MESESWLPRVDEPMIEYLQSGRYRNSSPGIVFSDFKGQEEANYAFWRNLSNAQRLELHTIMSNSLYKNLWATKPEKVIYDIIFNALT